MKTGKSNDLKIVGSMTLPGGNYTNVIVVGELELNGDTNIENDLNVVGNGIINGNLKFNSGKISGKSTFTGNTAGDYINVAGKLYQNGDIKMKNFFVEGSAEVRGNVASDSIDVSGELVVSGNCNSEEFKSRGSVRINGMLNAGTVELKLYARSNIKEIGGENIIIKKGTALKFWNAIKSLFLPEEFFHSRLSVEIVEGDNVALEYTKAGTVRGSSVTVGPDCEIDIVEYKNDYIKAEGSVVKTARKI